TGPKMWLTLGKTTLRVIVIVALAYLVIRIGSRAIERIFRGRKHNPFRISVRREETLKKLTTNVLASVVYFSALVMILETLSLPVESLLAAAGVAAGFGAQRLVRDVISGVFNVFEDQFFIGDYVIASEVEGEVEEIGLRTG